MALGAFYNYNYTVWNGINVDIFTISPLSWPLVLFIIIIIQCGMGLTLTFLPCPPSLSWPLVLIIIIIIQCGLGLTLTFLPCTPPPPQPSCHCPCCLFHGSDHPLQLMVCASPIHRRNCSDTADKITAQLFSMQYYINCTVLSTIYVKIVYIVYEFN